MHPTLKKNSASLQANVIFLISELTWEVVGGTSLAILDTEMMVYEDAKKACEALDSMLLEFWSEEEFTEVKNNHNIHFYVNSCHKSFYA